ncbi:hypothetical protein CLV63_11228 [Murinocardiopsis flavida]|uniref:Uncharacterized protein n=1 Tax=Murinocardiopsis flavida TaxID=645275 RepID=A0A2P8DG14_9ACTN|nr:hypothetical protein [Murinocardiopsis flavida]PSK96146.1 hypothetical protein CLV63_11228 [Murinocardiopsis flavida]
MKTSPATPTASPEFGARARAWARTHLDRLEPAPATPPTEGGGPLRDLTLLALWMHLLRR